MRFGRPLPPNWILLLREEVNTSRIGEILVKGIPVPEIAGTIEQQTRLHGIGPRSRYTSKLRTVGDLHRKHIDGTIQFFEDKFHALIQCIAIHLHEIIVGHHYTVENHTRTISTHNIVMVERTQQDGLTNPNILVLLRKVFVQFSQMDIFQEEIGLANALIHIDPKTSGCIVGVHRATVHQFAEFIGPRHIQLVRSQHKGVNISLLDKHVFERQVGVRTHEESLGILSLPECLFDSQILFWRFIQIIRTRGNERRDRND